ncbi:MAG: reverse transcriptase family protein, partial [Cyanobacteria bacterium J06600_6]
MRRGGGVFLLVRSDLKPVEYLFHNNDDQALFEDSVWCSINNPTSVLIGCLYRSPLSSCSNDATLCALIHEACSSFDGHKMILGDFNCPDIDWEHMSSQPSTQFLVDCCNNNFLHQMVTVPTRGNNVLDLVLVDDSSFVADLVVSAPFPGSDHLSVNVTIEFNNANVSNMDNSNNNFFKSLDFSKAQWEYYRNILASIDTDELFVSGDVNIIWDRFKALIHDAATKSIPVRKPSRSINGTPLTGEVLRAFRARKKTFQQTKSSNSSWALDLRRRAEDRLSLAIRNSRVSHEKKIAMACKKDVKRFWKHVRASLANGPHISRVVTPSGLLSESDSDTANCLNDLFASFFTDEEDESPSIPLRTVDNLDHIVVTADKILAVLRYLPNGSAPGPDGITYEMIKEGGDTMIRLLIKFYNMLLSNGELPNEWKVAHIIPIHKGGSKSRCENYRPISLTCAICKILEAVIKTDILVFLSNSNTIFSSQHGFLPGRSTATALLSFLEDVSLYIEDYQNVDAIYLDFKKAFDSVPHKRLVGKLKSYGIQSPLLSWIRSFLADRYQSVRIGKSFSKYVKVVSGVLQDSSLGPLLFL